MITNIKDFFDPREYFVEEDSIWIRILNVVVVFILAVIISFIVVYFVTWLFFIAYYFIFEGKFLHKELLVGDIRDAFIGVTITLHFFAVFGIEFWYNFRKFW